MNCVTINNQQIPWSFVQSVRRACGGDWDMTMDAFWKARDKLGPNAIIRYIAAGLRPGTTRYTLLPSKEREEGEPGMQRIRAWWESTVYQRKNEPKSIKQIFEGIAAGSIG